MSTKKFEILFGLLALSRIAHAQLAVNVTGRGGCNQAHITVDVSAQPSILYVPSLAAPVVGEIPAGALDGVNNLFTLSGSPAPMSLTVFVDGVPLKLGTDYVMSGRSIAFVRIVPTPANVVTASYYRLCFVVEIAPGLLWPRLPNAPAAPSLSVTGVQ